MSQDGGGAAVESNVAHHGEGGQVDGGHSVAFFIGDEGVTGEPSGFPPVAGGQGGQARGNELPASDHGLEVGGAGEDRTPE